MKFLYIIKRLFRSNRVLFCDLDGTLIKTKSGKIFPVDINDWELKMDTINAIRKYDPDYLFIVSNLGGIEKGFVHELQFRNKMDDIESLILFFCPKVVIRSIWCSVNDPADHFRKPNAGMIQLFKTRYPFFKYLALMIGDASGLSGLFSDSDKMCALNAGIRYMDINLFIKCYD